MSKRLTIPRRTIGVKINNCLVERERSEGWLAKKLDVSPNTINKIVRGGGTDYALAVRIAKVLGLRLNYLLDDEVPTT